MLETEVLVLKKAHPRQGEVPVLIFDTKKQDRSLYSQSSDGISCQKLESTRSNGTDVMAQICKKLSALPKMQRPVYFSDMPIMKADTGKILYAKMQERLSHDKDLEFFQLDWPQ